MRRGSGATLGLDRLFIKDESLNPTNSFKARGLSAAITRARGLDADTWRFRPPATPATPPPPMPRRPAWRARCSSRRTPSSPSSTNAACTAPTVTLVDGLITDAGRLATEQRHAARLVRRGHAQRAGPHRGQEDHGLRAGRAAASGRCPTGSSIPPAAAPASSACGRRSTRCRPSAGSHGPQRPRMVSVQAEGCAPIVRAFTTGRRPRRTVGERHTVADGLRVPRAIGDFLILQAVRDSAGHRRRGFRRGDGARHAARSARSACRPRPKARRRCLPSSVWSRKDASAATKPSSCSIRAGH